MKVDPLDIETEGWEALCAGAGVEFYERVMADDGVMLLPGAGKLAKAEALEGLRQAPAWSWFKMKDLGERAITDDVAVVTYTGSAQRGDDPVYEALKSSTYIRRDEQWRLVFHQQTPTT